MCNFRKDGFGAYRSLNLIAHKIALMLSYSMLDVLDNPKNVKFKDLLNICIHYFGKPRISGSHHIFKMPWFGYPRINLQRDGKMAKPYQVKQVFDAIKKLEEFKK